MLCATPLLIQSKAETTSPDWQSWQSHPCGVSRGCDQCNPVECPSTACTTTPDTATTVPSPGGSWTHDEPCHAQCSQKVQHPVGWVRNRALQSRCINSSSVHLFDIPDTREMGHYRRNVLNSSLKTEGPVAPAMSMRVTSWNPQGVRRSVVRY